MTKITTQAEKLARLIRDELGPLNDEDDSVVNLIRKLVDRLASTSPAPDAADLSLIEEAIGFAPYDIRDAARLAFYRIKAAAPQPVVEKENG